MRNPILLSLAFVAACTGADELTAPGNLPHQSNANVDWRDQMIYQIVVDRFADGDPNNNLHVQPSIPGSYHGGDWQGIIDHLDYLQALGVTALWISPVVKNTESDAGFYSYHGYWTQDFLRPNAHFGDVAKLRELVDDAHARGMLVILDVVTNHMGQLFYYDINGNGQPDDTISGGGAWSTCTQICNVPATASQCSADEQTYCAKGSSYLSQILEWDPEYDPRGIQGWTSLGFNGPAIIRFPDWPDQNRTVPPRPPDWFGWPADKPWFDDPSWFHRKGRVYTWWHESDYSKEFVREQETTGDFPGGLKDLNTDNPDVQDALSDVFAYWIQVADFDGFRIDTVKHIDRPEVDPDQRGFWGVFLDRMRKKAHDLGKQNFFIFGESFDGNDALDGAYTFPGHDAQGGFGRFDGVFYFSQYYEGIIPVFKKDAPTKNLECLYNARMGRNPTDSFCQNGGYPAGPTYYNQPVAMPADGGTGLAPQQTLVNFLDNHDVARFLFDDGTYTSPVTEDNLKAALFYDYTWDGVPCLYYGTEQLFHGGVDPMNREDMFGGNPDAGFPAFDTTNEAFTYVKALIQMRKDHEALRRGTVDIKWSTSQAGARRDEGIFAFERAAPNEKAMVVINASAQASETCAPTNEGGACMATTFAAGTVLRDVSPNGGGQTFTVAAGGTLDVTVPAHSGRVLVP
jgi:glycosidase